MQSQTKIFSRLVRDHMRPGPVIVSPDTTVEEVIAAMIEARASNALIAEPDQGLVGIFTERDITRRVALRCEGTEPISAVMTSPPRSVQTSDFLFHAIARMRRFGHRHMPVVDLENQPAGIIHLHEAIAVAAEQQVGLIDLLTQEGSIDGLREVKAVQIELAEQLFADSLPAPEIQALLTHINNDIYRRATESALADMKEAGLGEPPLAFDVIVMGSSGRGENFLFSDQDNGFILDDCSGERHGEIDAFFIELAERMTLGLDRIGFPLCRGHVMATNPVWRKSISEWKAQSTRWFQKRTPFALQLCDIFFDFQPVHGEGKLARELRRHLSALLRGGAAFLQGMFENEAGRHVALGLFGRLRTDRDDPARPGEINLKHGGLMPLVGSARLLALQRGIENTPTLERINALRKQGALGAEEADDLRAAFEEVTGTLLRQQLRDFRSGKKISCYVPPGALTRREKKLLAGALKTIDSLQERVRMEFTASVF